MKPVELEGYLKVIQGDSDCEIREIDKYEFQFLKTRSSTVKHYKGDGCLCNDYVNIEVLPNNKIFYVISDETYQNYDGDYSWYFQFAIEFKGKYYSIIDRG